MKKFKIPALLLCFSMLITLAACQNNTSAPSETAQTTSAESSTAETSAVESAIPELEERDLEGFKMTLLKEPQENIAFSTLTFAASQENGEVLNDAIVRRNQKITEKYNFELAEQTNADPLGTMTKQIMSGDSEYDLFMIQLRELNAVATGEYLINWYDVPNIVLEGEWWDQDMQRDLDLGKGIYFMNGDIIFTVYDCLRAVMYNKGLVEDFKLEETYGDFYDMATDGKWTVDRHYEMMEIVTSDLNGDGVMNYLDRFGNLYNNKSHAALLTAQDQQLVKAVDGYPEMDVFNERFTKVYENILKINSGTSSFDYNSDKFPGLTARQAIVTLFDNKQALFFNNGISAASQYMRDVQNVDFGFLPLPKFDEAQEKYYSYVSVSAPVICFPRTIADDRLEACGFILEALCRESSLSVVPEYFDTCFSAKYTRDERSYEMIVLATESIRYDLGIIYDYSDICTKFTTYSESNNEGVISMFESIRPAVEQAIIEYHGERN